MLPMDSRTRFEVLVNETGQVVKVVAKSLSRLGVYFLTQCKKINVEQSVLEEKIRYSNKLNSLNRK